MNFLNISRSTFSKSVLFIQQKKNLMVPASCITAALIIFLRLSFPAALPVQLEPLPQHDHQSFCYNETNEVVISLGTRFHPSRHCLLVCVREEKQKIAVFDCQDSTKYWISQRKLHQLPNTKTLENCDEFHFKELCRVPLVLELINHGNF